MEVSVKQSEFYFVNRLSQEFCLSEISALTCLPLLQLRGIKCLIYHTPYTACIPFPMIPVSLLCAAKGSHKTHFQSSRHLVLEKCVVTL
jgi:hypothetical protein